MAVAGRPVPEVPAAHDRLDLRRRPARRAHRPPRRRLGTDREDGAGRPGLHPRVGPRRVLAAHGAGRGQARRADPGRWSDDHDGAEPDPRTIARLERDAAVASRPAKVHGIDAGDAARRLGSRGPGRRLRPDRPRCRPDPCDRPPCRGGSPTRTVVAEALRRVCARSRRPGCGPTSPATSPPSSPDHGGSRRPSWSPRSTGSPPRPSTVRRARTRAAGPRRRRVGTGGRSTEHVTDRRFTTPAVLDQETRPAGLGPARATSDPAGPTGDPQRAAPSAIAGHDRLVLRGRPGRDRQDHHHRPRRRTPPRPGPTGASGSPRRARPPTSSPTRPAARPRPWPGSSPATDGHRPSPWPAGTTVDPRRGRHGRHRRPRRARRPRRSNTTGGSSPSATPPSSPPSAGAACSPTGATPSPTTSSTEPRRFTEPWEAARQPRPPRRRPRRRRAPTPHHGRLHTAHPALVADAGRPRPPAPRRRRTHRRHHHHQRRDGPGDQPGDPAPATPDATAAASRSPTAPRACVGDQIATRRNDPTLRTDRASRSATATPGPSPPSTPTAASPSTTRDRGTVELPADYVAAARRARLGRHRLRQPRRHRRHRHRRPRTRHHPQPRLRRHDPRPPDQPRLAPRPHRHPTPPKQPRRHHRPRNRPRLRPRPTRPPPPPSRPQPARSAPTLDRDHLDRVAAITARLDRLQQRPRQPPGRSLGR